MRQIRQCHAWRYRELEWESCLAEFLKRCISRRYPRLTGDSCKILRDLRYPKNLSWRGRSQAKVQARSSQCNDATSGCVHGQWMPNGADPESGTPIPSGCVSIGPGLIELELGDRLGD